MTDDDASGAAGLGAADEAVLRQAISAVRPGPMPDHVRDGIHLALDRAAHEREANEREAHDGVAHDPAVHDRGAGADDRPSRWTRWLPVAAAAAAVVVLVGVVWPRGPEQSSETVAAAGPTDCRIRADADMDMSRVMSASGANYRGATWAQDVSARAGSLNCTAAPDPAAAESSGRSSTDQDAPEAAPGQAEVPDARGLTRVAALPEPIVRACVVKVLPGRTVTFIDAAFVNGRSATVVLVSEPDEVVALDCASGRPGVIERTVLSGG